MTCDNGPLRHKHHIVPRYKGGTDDPENLVEVSVTQHAMYHYCNYQLWANVEDYVDWRGLSGQISEQEFLAEKLRLFGTKGAKALKKRIESDPKMAEEASRKRSLSWQRNKEKNLKQIRINQPLAVEAARSPEARKKKMESLKQIKHQQGEKNSQYGKRWIHNKQLKTSKRIGNIDPLPKDWEEGRIVDFESHSNMLQKRENNKLKTKQKREKKRQENIKFYVEWYKIYQQTNFKEFCQITGYNKSQQNLCSKFQVYVKEYAPKGINKYTP